MTSQSRFSSLRQTSRPALQPVLEVSSDAALDDDNDWVDITHRDLPIKLDDPVWHTNPSLSLITPPAVTVTDHHHHDDARSITESLTLTLRPDFLDTPYNHSQHVRSRPSLSLGRLKNLSKVSLHTPQSLKQRFSKVLRRNSKQADTRSILDEFPRPPSHLPTPITPIPEGHAWSSKADTPHTRINSVSSTSSQKVVAKDAKKPLDTHPTKNPLKTITKVFTAFNVRAQPATQEPVKALPPLPPPSPVLPPPPQQQHPVVENTESLQEESIDKTPVPIITVTLNDGPSTNTTPHEFVDPRKLGSDPSPLFGAEVFGTASTRSSFLPPSPSYLSRNVLRIDTSNLSEETSPSASEGPITPPSPAPIPIPPRIVITPCPGATYTPPLSPLEGADTWLKHLDSVAQNRYSTFSNISNLSRKSSASSLAGLFASPDRSDSRNALTPVLLFSSTNIEQSPSSPAAIPLSSSHFGFTSSDFLRTPSFQTPSSNFDSPRGNLEANAPQSSTRPILSSNLINLLSVICKEARLTMAEQGGELWGKRADIVDFGGEVDYSGVEWFKDPPPEQTPAPKPQSVQVYDPEPMVVQQNEHYGFALSASPNVLYGRWKQYGQLGVLGWCSEFAELIDSLKDLGIAGNMFLETRRKALEACVDILKLKMDIKMQIVVMYLTAQVQRLRRFLDPDGEYTDYPEPAFPLDPYQQR